MTGHLLLGLLLLLLLRLLRRRRARFGPASDADLPTKTCQSICSPLRLCTLRRALAAAEEPLDQLDRATSIGTSVELLAKAALALISPTLIAEQDPKSLLLYSGVLVPGMSAREAKKKLVADCLQILRHSHSVNFNSQTDQKFFAVRNLALHIGQVDATSFNEELTITTRPNEEILTITTAHDGTLEASPGHRQVPVDAGQGPRGADINSELGCAAI
jgi:hypothetical protein